ncbi:MAG TPA: hypothetical protein V6C84_26535 [Coleofasciculaceae cyanobacterium]
MAIASRSPYFYSVCLPLSALPLELYLRQFSSQAEFAWVTVNGAIASLLS